MFLSRSSRFFQQTRPVATRAFSSIVPLQVRAKGSGVAQTVLTDNDVHKIEVKYFVDYTCLLTNLLDNIMCVVKSFSLYLRVLL